MEKVNQRGTDAQMQQHPKKQQTAMTAIRSESHPNAHGTELG